MVDDDGVSKRTRWDWRKGRAGVRTRVDTKVKYDHNSPPSTKLVAPLRDVVADDVGDVADVADVARSCAALPAWERRHGARDRVRRLPES